MNTRLQVEHPITEMITGLDLVKWQIQVALGQRLSFEQTNVTARGHALECRVYAEDAANGFLPAVGPVLLAKFPAMPGVRVDSGIETGDEISIHYDPMIAKIIAHGSDRADAIRKMQAALAHTVILGVTTNVRFLRDLLAQPIFQRGLITTDYIERELSGWQPRASDQLDQALIAAALTDLSSAPERTATSSPSSAHFDPWQVSDHFRLSA
jgi:acetyl/propionyl-CoA carboxylase alpha subunit